MKYRRVDVLLHIFVIGLLSIVLVFSFFSFQLRHKSIIEPLTAEAFEGPTDSFNSQNHPTTRDLLLVQNDLSFHPPFQWNNLLMYKPLNKVPQRARAEVKLQFAGDVMMDSVIGDYIQKFGVMYPWKDVAPVFANADLTSVNLETSVSTRGVTSKPKGYGFRSHPSTVQGLRDSGVDFVSLANNHSLDYGIDAMVDTLAILDENGIAYAGAGLTIQKAEQLTTIQRNGLKIGFLSYTSIIPHAKWIAKDNQAGIAALKNIELSRILKHIQEQNNQCDILVVVLHWGIEHSNQVETWQRNVAKQMIEHGADVIVGHHPHVLRGIEFYQNKPILYSTGNFIFLKRDEKAGHSAIFEITLNKAGFIDGKLIPIHIQYGKANLLRTNSALYHQIISNMKQLSNPLGTSITEAGTFSPYRTLDNQK
jgi:poly-gamma-glutamate capsule biosynthesis protein CapA/YwtB (metallophosphatase superfamily)